MSRWWPWVDNARYFHTFVSDIYPPWGLADVYPLGLFVGSGSALASGGPVALWIGYCLMATMVYAMMVALGEMATLFPVAGAFTHYASRFVDESLGFVSTHSFETWSSGAGSWLLLGPQAKWPSARPLFTFFMHVLYPPRQRSVWVGTPATTRFALQAPTVASAALSSAYQHPTALVRMLPCRKKRVHTRDKGRVPTTSVFAANGSGSRAWGCGGYDGHGV